MVLETIDPYNGPVRAEQQQHAPDKSHAELASQVAEASREESPEGGDEARDDGGDSLRSYAKDLQASLSSTKPSEEDAPAAAAVEEGGERDDGTADADDDGGREGAAENDAVFAAAAPALPRARTSPSQGVFAISSADTGPSDLDIAATHSLVDLVVETTSSWLDTVAGLCGPVDVAPTAAPADAPDEDAAAYTPPVLAAAAPYPARMWLAGPADGDSCEKAAEDPSPAAEGPEGEAVAEEEAASATEGPEGEDAAEEEAKPEEEGEAGVTAEQEAKTEEEGEAEEEGAPEEAEAPAPAAMPPKEPSFHFNKHGKIVVDGAAETDDESATPSAAEETGLTAGNKAWPMARPEDDAKSTEIPDKDLNRYAKAAKTMSEREKKEEGAAKQATKKKARRPSLRPRSVSRGRAPVQETGMMAYNRAMAKKRAEMGLEEPTTQTAAPVDAAKKEGRAPRKTRTPSLRPRSISRGKKPPAPETGLAAYNTAVAKRRAEMGLEEPTTEVAAPTARKELAPKKKTSKRSISRGKKPAAPETGLAAYNTAVAKRRAKMGLEEPATEVAAPTAPKELAPKKKAGKRSGKGKKPAAPETGLAAYNTAVAKRRAAMAAEEAA